MAHAYIYTDGAARPNPGPGGYGVVLLYGKHRKELSCGFVRTTNNRMELLAVIAGLESLKRACRVTIYSDSRYVCDAVNKKRLDKWRLNGWRIASGQDVKNVDLWKRFLVASQPHEIQLCWIRGHSGTPENERCDGLATQASRQRDRHEDDGFAEDGAGPGQAINSKQRVVDEVCRKCGSPVERRVPSRKRKPGQTYYYEWYLRCTGCRTMYLIDEAKRAIPADGTAG